MIRTYRKLAVIALVFMLGGLPQIVSAQKLHTVNIKNLKQLQRYFKYSAKKPIIISGHRGGMMPNYPENSIASCEKTLSLMPSFLR